jgi:phosphatidylserine/phosphatidylglycerophosphate/cardiolipin synthase-like enzyme
VADPDLAVGLRWVFDRDTTRSKRWTAAEWRKRPWHWKVREKFWGLFGEIF